MIADSVLYDVSLRMTQRYASTAGSGRHVLRLVPTTDPGEQEVIISSLTIEPEPDERRNSRDFFGNGVVETAFTKPHDKIEFKVTARVRRSTVERRPETSTALALLGAELAGIRSLAPGSPHHFVGASPKVPILAELAAYARECIDPGGSALAAVEAVGKALHRDLRFDPKATEVSTPVAEAFAQRHGVCQDFSHIMIGCLRGIGIPAGYVSGFIRTIPPKGRPRMQGADAMHAWVQAWCGTEAGWVEYDPTNEKFAGGDHIVVGRGRDYADVAPVKGVLRTAGAQVIEQAVDVIRVDDGG